MMRLALVLAAGFAVQQAAATTCRATDARPLHESLRQNACHQLELEHSARTGDVAALADVIPTATNLVDIEVEGVPLSGADCEALAGAFALPRLDDVEAPRAGVDDACAGVFGAVLASNPPLRELQLAGNSITADGLGALLLGLETNTHLRKLGLNGNALDDAAADRLVEFLQQAQGSGLHSIALKGNALSHTAVQAIENAARAAGGRIRFDLRHQRPGTVRTVRNAAPGTAPARHPAAAPRAGRSAPERRMQQSRSESASTGRVELFAGPDASVGLREAVRGVDAGVLPRGNPLTQWDETATAEWVALLNAKFGKYRKLLVDGAVDFALLVDLEDAALAEVGIASATHRHRILREARQLLGEVRKQLPVSHTEL